MGRFAAVIAATGVLAAGVLATSACTIAGRTSTGGAMVQPGVETGTTRSVYLADRGGLLTRAGLTGLGAVAAMGSVSNVQSTTREVGRNDKTVTYETVTTGTVDPAAARRAQGILDAANDWNNELTGLTGGLEIASRDLGGDTSGWMFDFGGVGTMPIGGRFALRFAGKIKFGKMTFHDRMKRLQNGPGFYETGPDEQTFSMFGTPLRVGLTYRGFIETFFQADLNWVTAFRELVGEPASPSPWRTGLRGTIKWFYVEAELAWSAFREGSTSVGLEVGLAF